MKKYYLHNGTEQHGPYDFEALKKLNIKAETSIWHEGLSEWTTAGKLEELKDLIKASIPPPFVIKESSSTTQNSSPESVPTDYQAMAMAPKKKHTIFKYAISAVSVVLIVWLGVTLVDRKTPGAASYDSNGSSYKEKVMTVEEIERAEPAKFLSSEGTYNENFWGGKIKVHGVIKNAATVASYKDAVVRITYYSKTKTAVGTNDYIIYETFPPHSQVKFEIKIENYQQVASIGWQVIKATAL
jgi:hypothetical protein